jgi:large subunit ribosomal protein MRP49
MTPTILTLDAPLTVAMEEHATVELACAPPVGATLELHVAGVVVEPFLRPADPLWRWRWTAASSVGAFPVELRAHFPDGSTVAQTHTLAVHPRKLDLERYQALLTDVQALSRRLVLALGGGATPATLPPPSAPAPQTPADALALLTGAELEHFARAVTRIARRPPERTRPTITPVEPGRARDLSRLNATRLEIADDLPQTAAQPPAAQLRAIPEQQAAPTHDSYEVRFLQRVLTTVAQRLKQLAELPDLPPGAAAAIAQAHEQVHDLRALPALAGIPPLEQYRGPTPRLQRDADYRAVLRMWQRLRRTPELNWDDPTLQLPVAELPRLYERWCALATVEALLGVPGWRVVAQQLLSAPPADSPNEQRITLPTDTPLLTLERPDGAQAALRYQPRYRPQPQADRIGSLDRHTRVPDLAITITAPATPLALIILDAKYRLDPTGGVPEAALADAYSYLGSIGTPANRHTVRAAAILYPGVGPAEIYPSGVAALPLLPGNTTSLAGWLELLDS